MGLNSFERCKPHKAARHPTTVINDVRLLPIVYRRIYRRKFLMSSNQRSRYKLKCIRKYILERRTFVIFDFTEQSVSYVNQMYDRQFGLGNLSEMMNKNKHRFGVQENNNLS